MRYLCHCEYLLIKRLYSSYHGPIRSVYVSHTISERMIKMHSPYFSNSMLRNEIEVRIIDSVQRTQDFTISARTLRRHLLPFGLHYPSAQEITRSCLGVVLRKGEYTPALIIETKPLSAEMLELYNRFQAPWCLITQSFGKYQIDLHTNTVIQTATSYDLPTMMDMAIRSVANHGAPVAITKSKTEEMYYASMERCAAVYPVQCHWQVSLAEAIGFRPELRMDYEALSLDLDAIISLNQGKDSRLGTLLAVKIDIHDTHRTDAKVQSRDLRVRELCDRYNVPLLTITVDPQIPERYVFSCPKILKDPVTVPWDVREWTSALSVLLERTFHISGRPYQVLMAIGN